MMQVASVDFDLALTGIFTRPSLRAFLWSGRCTETFTKGSQTVA